MVKRDQEPGQEIKQYDKKSNQNVHLMDDGGLRLFWYENISAHHIQIWSVFIWMCECTHHTIYYIYQCPFTNSKAVVQTYKRFPYIIYAFQFVSFIGTHKHATAHCHIHILATCGKMKKQEKKNWEKKKERKEEKLAMDQIPHSGSM